MDAEEKLITILESCKELFRDEIRCVTHQIKLHTNRPYKAKTYPVPEIHRNKVKEHLLDLEEIDIIERATTQYVNPLVVVIKKSGEIRLCLDTRELNKRMLNDHEQPPTRYSEESRIKNTSVRWTWQRPFDKFR